MKSEERHAFKVLADAAERFVNKAPNQKRLEAERTALLDAILQAQLLLSVKAEGPNDAPSSPAPKRAKHGRLRLAK
ncbi:MAG TPA: hypothetical protein VHF07_07190 [Nitrospiraceae bacterium]|nr:hypothetical protein [Nitrospiraceae bacterium]